MGHCSFWRVQLFSPRSAQERTVKITNGAAAAVLADGSVVALGHPAFGGECSAVQDQLRNVRHLQSTPSAFAALANGSVVPWVNSTNGGDSSSVQNQLTSVQQVHATESAFAAILANSSVVTWGTAYEGGDSSSVQHLLKDVKQIQRSNVAFAAILGDGSVVTWGVPIYGGDSSVQDQLRDFTAAGVHLQRSWQMDPFGHVAIQPLAGTALKSKISSDGF